MTMKDSKEMIHVAIVGGGVTGLSAAWHLSQQKERYKVTVFENEDRLGGHAYTMSVNAEKTVDVDVGFMVYNSDNYPNMTKWFETLQVEPEKSDMALSVSLDGGSTLEWSSTDIGGFFANRQQLFSCSFYSFIADMLRFHEEAEWILTLNPKDPRRYLTVGEYLRIHKYSVAFGRNYLLPMMAALWSASMEDVLAFPMEQLVGFMCNHKMLRLFDRPLWNTVKGRSKSYTEKMKAILNANDSLKLSTPIHKAIKNENHDSISYELFTNESKSVGIYDHVIFACQPPIANKILSSNTNISQDLLSLLNQIEYADNIIYLHSDPKLMPKRKAAWASWNCLGKSALIETAMNNSFKKTKSEATNQESQHDRMRTVYVTYYLNRLQNLQTSTDIFVSLNPHIQPDPNKTYNKFKLAHPQFNQITVDAREILEKKWQGKDNLWFAGAWSGYGFHEDGCRSGFHVSTHLSDTPLPWVNHEKNQKTMVLPPPNLAKSKHEIPYAQKNWIYQLFVNYCKYKLSNYLNSILTKGNLQILLSDETIFENYGGQHQFSQNYYFDHIPNIILQVFDDHFFIDFALYGDEGLARSYIAGHFIVEIDNDETSSSLPNYPILGGNSNGLLYLFALLNINRDTYFENLKNQFTISSLVVSTYDKLPYILKIGPNLFTSILQYWSDNIIFYSNSLYYKNANLITKQYVWNLSPELLSPPSYSMVSMTSSTTKLSYTPAELSPKPHMTMIDTCLSLSKLKLNMNILLIDPSIYNEKDTSEMGSNWGIRAACIAMEALQKYKCKVHALTSSNIQYNAAKTYLHSKMNSTSNENIIFEIIPNMMSSNCHSLLLHSKNIQTKRLQYDRVLILDTYSLIEKASSLQENRPFMGSIHRHCYTPVFFTCMENLVNKDGLVILETSTMNEKRTVGARYSYSTSLPSIYDLMNAVNHGSTFVLENIDNLCLQNSKTLQSMRHKLNDHIHSFDPTASDAFKTANDGMTMPTKLDDTVWRAFHFYNSYCQAAFQMFKLTSAVLVFARPGSKALLDFNRARELLTTDEAHYLIEENH